MPPDACETSDKACAETHGLTRKSGVNIGPGLQFRGKNWVCRYKEEKKGLTQAEVLREFGEPLLNFESRILLAKYCSTSKSFRSIQRKFLSAPSKTRLILRYLPLGPRESNKSKG